MSRGASRTYRFEDAVYEDGSVVSYREDLAQNVLDFLSTLHVVGGMLSIVAIRDDLGVDPATGQKVFETRGAIVEWRQAAPVRNAAPRETLADVGADQAAELEAERAAEDGGEWDGDEDLLLSAEPDESELEGVTA